VHVAQGPGPRPLRLALAGLAALYYAALLKHPTNEGAWRPIAFFTNATCLFPRSDSYSIEYRLAAWSCTDVKWEPLDPRPYFPIQADDKESRLQRVAYFYKSNRTVMRALDAFVVDGHDHGAPDGVAGRLGGIRLFEVLRPLPAPGDAFDRYVFDPLAELPKTGLREAYYTPGLERRSRCGR
jgi:hypothetical protein